MNTLRWIAFPIVGLLSVAIAQSIGVALATLPWWLAIPVLLLFGIVFYFGGALPVRFAPNKAIGATILLAIFIPVEFLALLANLNANITVFALFARLYIAIAIILGAILDAQNTKRL